jgi:ABC-type antimicrobial peptide transport system permease subunit
MVARAFLTAWLIRTTAPLDLAAAQRAVREVDPTQPVVSLRTMTEVIEASPSLALRRFVGALLNTFAGLALLLALVGVYGIVSSSVNRRTREIGLRAALGATRGELVALVLGQGARLAVAGVVVGLVAAVGVARFLRGLLFGVQPADPMVLVLAGLALSATALLASWGPARRAVKIDPMSALRFE